MITDKCQELIELSQRKNALTKYAKNLTGFQSRQEQITKSVKELKPLIVALRAFRQRGLATFDLTQKVDTFLGYIATYEEKFREDPEWILDNKNFKGNIFASSVVSLKTTLKQELIQAWKNYLAEYLPSTNKEMLGIFNGIEALKPAIQKIYSLDQKIQQVEFPNSSEEFERVENLIAQMRNVLESLNSDNIPEEVLTFLKAAVNQGATINLLTPEVKEWLIEYRLADSVRIRLI